MFWLMCNTSVYILYLQYRLTTVFCTLPCTTVYICTFSENALYNGFIPFGSEVSQLEIITVLLLIDSLTG